MPRASFRVLYSRTRIPVLVLAGLVWTCASYKPVPVKFQSLRGIDRRIEVYRRWLTAEKPEVVDAKRVLKPFFSDLLKRDYSDYQKLFPPYEAFVNSYDSLAVWDKRQSALIDNLKKQKPRDINSRDKNSKKTYLEIFTANDLEILRYQHQYEYSRGRMISAFNKKNYRCVFIKDQLVQWQSEIDSLQARRKVIEIDEKKIITDFALSINSETGTADAYLVKKVKILNSIKRELDSFEQMFPTIEKTAEAEIGGRMTIALIGQPPKKYETKMSDALSRYNFQLMQLSALIRN